MQLSSTNEVVELFGHVTTRRDPPFWKRAVSGQHCPYLSRRCIKVRKSQPHILIGTCTVKYGTEEKPVMICPYRLLERRQIFSDALHLLTLHEPGNELHVVPEIAVPGGSVDYFLVSARRRKPVDFVGIELQTLDTTGTVWPARQRFLRSVGLAVKLDRVAESKGFGMNWKMTAKTILVQLHHKVETFEHVGRHLLLVLQDCLLDYMRREFTFGHFSDAKLGHPMHVHAYSLRADGGSTRLELIARCSTDSAGISTALGLQAKAKVELEAILAAIEPNISDQTLWSPA